MTGKAVNNRVKATLDPKGKGKESVAIKPTKPPATATVGTTSRVPLRPVPARSKTNNAPQVKIKSDAIVLEPTAKAVPVVEIPVHPNPARRAPFRSTTSTNIASTTVTTNRRVTQKKVRSVYLDRDLAPINEEPLTKKRRTSSEAPEEVVEEDSDALAENVLPESTAVPSAETQDWDDLDREDDDDPLMVSEYVVDIFNYLKLLEVSIPLPSVRDGYINPRVQQNTMPNPNYMENQKELAWKMRGILMDWLIQVHSRFKLMPETLFLCVNLIDRFLSARVVSLAKLQLVGVTCMFVAAKVEETIAPSVTNFIYCADSSYTEQEILQAEKYILKTLDWNLSYPCPLNFLRRISKADDYNVQVRTIGKYLLEIGCLEWRLLAAPPSLMAAASMWLARLILDLPDWVSCFMMFNDNT